MDINLDKKETAQEEQLKIHIDITKFAWDSLGHTVCSK